jgi:hypothetical protein
MTQEELPFQSHSDTSRDAARSKQGDKKNEMSRVFWHLVNCADHGATDEEVQHALGMIGSTERPRRVELMDGGIVVDSGGRRPTMSGRSATVWKIPVERREKALLDLLVDKLRAEAAVKKAARKAIKAAQVGANS